MSVLNTILTYIQTAITSLTSTSKTAIYANIADSIAPVVDNTIAELENTKTIISNVIGLQRYGRSGYYITKAKAFQLGDDLIPAESPLLDPIYATISDDPAVLIIKQASFEIQNIDGLDTGVLKVATENESGELIELSGVGQTETSPEQMIQFKNYFTQFEIIGIPINVVSLPPNILAYTLDIVYSKTYDLTELMANIVLAEETFKNTFTFNGLLFLGYLIDYITDNVPGVLVCNITSATLDGEVLDGVEIDGITFTDASPLSAGYFNYGTLVKNYGGI